MNDVVPNKGPITGNTPLSIAVKGIGQPGVCNIKVRLGTYDFTPVNHENTDLQITNDAVPYPGIVAVQVAFNGQ